MAYEISLEAIPSEGSPIEGKSKVLELMLGVKGVKLIHDKFTKIDKWRHFRDVNWQEWFQIF